MTRTARFLIMLGLLSLAQSMSCCYAFDLPEEAFLYLAESATDPCSICAKQKVKKAFGILDKNFVPGTLIRSDGACSLVKTGSGTDLTLSCYPSVALFESLKEGEVMPQLVFAFYTGEDRLVGISAKDYTDRTLAESFHASKPGTVFDGELKIIPYAYGDGPTYNYFQQANKLQVHCVIVKLTPVSGSN
jgi:hypothetical protein